MHLWFAMSVFCGSNASLADFFPLLIAHVGRSVPAEILLIMPKVQLWVLLHVSLVIACRVSDMNNGSDGFWAGVTIIPQTVSQLDPGLQLKNDLRTCTSAVTW
ncbi:hypothetical protein C8Q74DRAFT_238943 [Fomes fomentarius]|nr:hypothetical protein C8Q74DRAFT_238943 [Fomes fomentarius]